MGNVIKIIISILGALTMFLAGWFLHAWKNRKAIAKEVKKTIADVNKEHKKALEALKLDYEKKLKKKDEIIADLHSIIDCLLNVLLPLQSSNAFGVDKLINNLNKNKEKLYKL